MTRYTRQTILDAIGSEGQDILGKTRILIVGLGGLGSPAALYLAAAGIGTLGLVDADTVSISNLQRQILFQSQEEGRLKIEAARERLLALNPETEIIIHNCYLTHSNAVEICADYDLILDGSDNFASKFLLNALSLKLNKPLIYGSVLRFAGQASVFWPGRGPCYACLFPEAPRQGVMNCAEAGVLGVLPGIVGSVQALEAIKVALQLKGRETLEALVGRLWLLDAASMNTRILQLPRDPDCPVCSQEASQLPLPLVTFACTQAADADDSTPWLDVREAEEWQRGHIPHALHWPLSRLLRGEFPEYRKDLPLRIYCQSGLRSQQAMQILAGAGWQDLAHMQGGLNQWRGPLG